MTFGELGKFTFGELGHFTYEELSLPIDELLELIRDTNKPVSANTYAKLLNIADRLNIDVPSEYRHSPDELVKKRIIFVVIYSIIKFLFSTGSEQAINFFPINININIQNIDNISNEQLSDNCSIIQNVLDELDK